MWYRIVTELLNCDQGALPVTISRDVQAKDHTSALRQLMEVLPCSLITSGAIHDGVPLMSPLLAVASLPAVPLAPGALVLLRQCLLFPKSASLTC